MGRVERIRNFITESRRVLRISKKPTKQEYWTITKVSGLGILLIGLAGFLLHMTEVLVTIFLTTAIVFIIVLYLMFIKK